MQESSAIVETGVQEVLLSSPQNLCSADLINATVHHSQLRNQKILIGTFQKSFSGVRILREPL